VTDRDIACRLVADGRDADRVHVYDVMSGNVAFCRQDQDLHDAVKIMRTNGFRRLPVLDEQEQVVGLLSVDDLCWKVPDRAFTETMRAVIAAHHHRDEAGADSASL
jgi:predicted transcriptional regulator